MPLFSTLEKLSMKKTLIALAAVAATGAAFAQSSVTLSGAYAAGYESSKTAAGVKSAGFGTDTAAVKMSATEDLGGGLKAAAYVSAGGMVRGSAVGGEDAGLSLSGGFGTVHLRTIEAAGQGITSKASAGAPGYDLHGRVFSANANIDQIAYVLPKMGDLTASVNYVDRGTTGAATGLAQGTAGAASAQPSMGAALAYKAGPVDAGVDYTSWTRKGATDVTSNTTNNRVRMSGNYNLGMAKVGLGYSKLNRTGANLSTTETLIGLSAPVGALTVGATYGTSKGTATSSTAKKTGYTLGASYDLSKRTNVGFSTFSWKTAGVAGSNTGTRVLVAHSF
jgi:hypothetical protein